MINYLNDHTRILQIVHDAQSDRRAVEQTERNSQAVHRNRDRSTAEPTRRHLKFSPPSTTIANDENEAAGYTQAVEEGFEEQGFEGGLIRTKQG